MKRLAIIIPGYNCAKYIRKCLSSIVCQIHKNDKIIFVDDGSNDATAELVKKYFPQVSYVYQNNSGVSAARNKGLELASEYQFIMFIDSDDWLEKDSLLRIYEFIEISNYADYIMFDWNEYKLVNDKQKVIPACMNIMFDSGITQDDLIKHLLCSRSGGSPWGKVFKNKIIKEHNITFKEGIPYSEDYLFNLTFLKYVQTIRYFPEQLYAYNCCNIGEGARFRKNRVDILEQIESEKYLLYGSYGNEYRELMVEELVEQYKVSIANLKNNSFSTKERIVELKKLKYILEQRDIDIRTIFKTHAKIRTKLFCVLFLMIS